MPPQRASRGNEPRRWPIATAPKASTATRATSEAGTMSESGAPRAGGTAAKAVAAVTSRNVPSINGTLNLGYAGTMERLTIDELARRAGLTTRNVRAYQERGLLPPPTKVGRTGYYDDGHLGRLRMISGLLERGYSLAAIADLLRTWEEGGDVGELLGLDR